MGVELEGDGRRSQRREITKVEFKKKRIGPPSGSTYGATDHYAKKNFENFCNLPGWQNFLKISVNF